MKGTKTSLLGIVGLVFIGVAYLLTTPPAEYSQPVLLTIIGGICGLGGYQIRKLQE